MTAATQSILVSSINREDLDDRLFESGLVRDLEAEIDSRYVLLGDEISVVDGVSTLNALSEHARVAPHDLGFVFWVWVSNDDLPVVSSSDRDPNTFLSSDYIAHASEPFGNIINLTSGSSDDGNYVACVISYSQLLELLCEVESEVVNSA